MSKYTPRTKKQPKAEYTKVTTFEGGVAYQANNPIRRLKMILSSSIFGEPSFYESGDKRAAETVALIKESLDYDFVGTVNLAVQLRELAWMRLNPIIILVHAAIHKNRANVTATNPNLFNHAVERVALRPDDLTTLIEYFMYLNKGSKKKLPSILKRAVARRLEYFDSNAYLINKYKGKGMGLINVARITHPRANQYLAELLKTGDVSINDTEQTWLNLRSQGVPWSSVVKQIRLTHQDVLYQMRNLISDLSLSELKPILERFTDQAGHSKVFPYKYFNLYDVLSGLPSSPNKRAAISAVKDAFIRKTANSDKLAGKTCILVDVSGSMGQRATFQGTVFTCARLAASSAALAAAQCESVSVMPFATSSRLLNGVFTDPFATYELVQDDHWNLGGGTNMVQALDTLLDEDQTFDSIIIYTDDQITMDRDCYWNSGGSTSVMDFIEKYRKSRNSKMSLSVTSIAGYSNGLVMNEVTPQGAATVQLTGWTGLEVEYLIELQKSLA